MQAKTERGGVRYESIAKIFERQQFALTEVVRKVVSQYQIGEYLVLPSTKMIVVVYFKKGKASAWDEFHYEVPTTSRASFVDGLEALEARLSLVEEEYKETMANATQRQGEGIPFAEEEAPSDNTHRFPHTPLDDDIPGCTRRRCEVIQRLGI